MRSRPFLPPAYSSTWPPGACSYLQALKLSLSWSGWATTGCSGYMRPFQDRDAAGIRRFRSGTTFQDVLDLYEFDRKLRLLAMDAAERIEVALRAAVVSEVAVPHGPHFYMNSRHFATSDACTSFMQAVSDERRRSEVLCTTIPRTAHPPCRPSGRPWKPSASGRSPICTSNLATPLRKAVATRFGYHETVLISWIRSMAHLRNVAAHHGRLWNARLSVDKPKRAKPIKDEFGQSMSTFCARAVVAVALFEEVGHDRRWKHRLRDLLDKHPFVNERTMGFPVDWRRRPFWNS